MPALLKLRLRNPFCLKVSFSKYSEMCRLSLVVVKFAVYEYVR